MKNWQQRYEQRRHEQRGKACLGVEEAAHALVAFVYGAKIVRIVMCRDDPNMPLRGTCYWRSGENDHQLDKLYIAMAGPVANTILNGLQEDPYSSDARQIRQASTAIAEAQGRSAPEVSSEARAHVGALVRHHAAAIRTLSSALLSARWTELSGEEVERILIQQGVRRISELQGHRGGAPYDQTRRRGPERQEEVPWYPDRPFVAADGEELVYRIVDDGIRLIA